MVYVDETLCTGCGLCLEACDRGAISLVGRAALIDESLCSACGRCAEICVTEAILVVEPVESESPVIRTTTASNMPAPTARTTMPPLVRAKPVAPAGLATDSSRLASLERALLHVLNLAVFAFDLKRGMNAKRGLGGARARGLTGAPRTGAGRCGRPRHGQGGMGRGCRETQRSNRRRLR